MGKNENQQTAPTDPALKQLDFLANLMDNQFRIPLTNIRFGLDSIIGLIPYAGDVAGLVVSLWLMGITVRKGAGPILLLKMAGNVMLDGIVGTVPFLGDIFDFGFKANRRNVNMLKKYYSEDKKRPSVWWSFAFFFLLLLTILILSIWLVYKAFAYFWGILT